MAGFSPNRTRAPAVMQTWQTTGDPCDLKFQIELVGIRSVATAHLAVEDVLDVVLVPRGQAVSAVCRTSHGDVVGAFAAFRGLAQLIRCLHDGIQFRARVVDASATRCEVRVERSS